MDQEQLNYLNYVRNRMDMAYKSSPTGNWFQRWIPGICRHKQIRCTHGDEIIHRNYKRRVCLICGRSLHGILPVRCFFTGMLH